MLFERLAPCLIERQLRLPDYLELIVGLENGWGADWAQQPAKTGKETCLLLLRKLLKTELERSSRLLTAKMRYVSFHEDDHRL